MAAIDRQDSLPSVPPPPPPIEDSNYTVRYGNGADTYTNNMMADDESVEAQHVVYTFAEEGKSSKAGRKKWICLMFSIASLLIAIIALGAVYGTQRRNRSNQIAQAKESEVAPTTTTNVTDVVNATIPTTLPEEDLYITTPANETLSNVTLSGNETFVNTTEIEEEDIFATETEAPTTWTTSWWGARIFPTDEPEESRTEMPVASLGSEAPFGLGTEPPSVEASFEATSSGTRWFPNRWGWGNQPAWAREGQQSF